MISAIVASLDRENLAVSPYGNVDLQSLVGKKVQYKDKFDKVWEGEVVAHDDAFLFIKFKEFPTSLGQGQLVEILDGIDEKND